jgi:hypothetical protein
MTLFLSQKILNEIVMLFLYHGGVIDRLNKTPKGPLQLYLAPLKVAFFLRTKTYLVLPLSKGLTNAN